MVAPQVRFAGIDGIRAVAVTLVVAAHAHVPGFHGGGIGVDIFFVISGFLITYLLQREVRATGRIYLSRFWMRRALRLFPALILVVGAVDVIALLSLRGGDGNQGLTQSLAATPSVVFYFSNWMIVFTQSPYLGWFGPLWSLAVEEQFYLFWPLVLLIFLPVIRRTSRLFPLGIVIIICALTVLRFFTFSNSPIYRTFGTDFRADMLLWGALLAVVFSDPPNFDSRVRKIACLISPLALGFVVAMVILVPDFNDRSEMSAQRFYYIYGLPFVGVASATLIAYVVSNRRSCATRILEYRPLVFVGKISYGIYLWHYPAILSLKAVNVTEPVPLFFVSLLLTILAASISWRVVERPVQAKFGPRFRSLTLRV